MLLSVIFTILFCACGKLEVKEGVQVNIENFSFYGILEIQSAIDVCLDYFNTNFEGCTMTEISYEEELCRKKGLLDYTI